jgi:hypothetical protein
VEHDPVAQAEPPGQAVVRCLPVGGQSRSQPPGRIGIDQGFGDLHALERKARGCGIGAGDLPRGRDGESRLRRHRHGDEVGGDERREHEALHGVTPHGQNDGHALRYNVDGGKSPRVVRCDPGRCRYAPFA